MATNEKSGNQGGTHEQHVKAGQQSSGNTGNSQQHAEAGKKGGAASHGGGKSK